VPRGPDVANRLSDEQLSGCPHQATLECRQAVHPAELRADLDHRGFDPFPPGGGTPGIAADAGLKPAPLSANLPSGLLLHLLH
jgi:hypothetical protein